MRKLGILAVAFAAGVLSACQTATPYQPLDRSGGVEAQQLTSNTYAIVARGNDDTSQQTVQDYALLKAAETALAAGATHFIVVSVQDISETELREGNNGNVDADVEPGQRMIIQVITVSGGSSPPQGAISAAEIVLTLGSSVVRP